MRDPAALPRDAFLSFSPPALGDDEIAEVVEALRSEWISTGPRTRAFEKELAAFVGSPGVLALNSCTAGLHTALLAAGIGPGDEVVTSTFTFAATANVIEHVGARPVLVDVEPDTLNLDPDRVAAAVTEKTRAIIPVHFAGHPAELDTLRQIARRHDLLLIEDAAHAFSATYRGARIGVAGNPVAFSFYATKNLTTGEGGALTGDEEFLERARIVSLHGISRGSWSRSGEPSPWRYEVVLPGYKYNMTDIQAALGLVQLRRLAGLQARRRAIVGQYQEAFRETPALEVPVEREEVGHAWHLYTLRLRSETLTIGRDRFLKELAARNIGTSVHFIPLHLHPWYRDRYGYAPEDFPVAYDSFERILSLPVHPRMGDRDTQDVIEAVLDLVQQFER